MWSCFWGQLYAEGYSKLEQATRLQISNTQSEVAYQQKLFDTNPNQARNDIIKGYKSNIELLTSNAQIYKNKTLSATELAKLYTEAGNNALELTMQNNNFLRTPFGLIKIYKAEKQRSKDKIAQKEDEVKLSRTVIDFYGETISSLEELLKSTKGLMKFQEEEAEANKSSNPSLSVLYAKKADAYHRIVNTIEQEITLYRDKTHFESVKEKFSESEQELWGTIYDFREAQVYITRATAETEIVHIEEGLRELR